MPRFFSSYFILMSLFSSVVLLCVFFLLAKRREKLAFRFGWLCLQFSFFFAFVYQDIISIYPFHYRVSPFSSKRLISANERDEHMHEKAFFHIIIFEVMPNELKIIWFREQCEESEESEEKEIEFNSILLRVKIYWRKCNSIAIWPLHTYRHQFEGKHFILHSKQQQEHFFTKKTILYTRARFI